LICLHGKEYNEQNSEDRDDEWDLGQLISATGLLVDFMIT
jgi:hypothetical protein